MSIRPQKTIKKVSIQQKVQDLGIKWSDSPEDNLKQLKKLSQELERKISQKDIQKIWGTDKAFKEQDIRDARKWFMDEVKRLMANPWEVNHKKMSKYTRGQGAINLPKATDIGKLFFYKYDPKLKAELPYYDMFPLILMINTLKDGWHGINLHYLPPKQRQVLISRLLINLSDTKLDNNTRLRINYKILKSASKYRLFKPCFKRYLVNHTRSSVRPIPMRHWAKAILLPVAQFKKASTSKVWAESLRIARG